MRRLAPFGAAAAGVLMLAGCGGGPPGGGAVQGGDAGRGRALIRQVGCGACHEIPGLRAAQGLVGPPLLHMARRTTIAGVLPNTPEDMVRWLQHPQTVIPRNAMPDMGLSEQQARDIAAYLESLQ